MMAANRKRKPGSMKRASSAFEAYLRRPLGYRERGEHRNGRVRGAAETASAQRIRLFENTATYQRRVLQIGGVNACSMGRKRFLNPMRLRCNAAAGSSQNA